MTSTIKVIFNCWIEMTSTTIWQSYSTESYALNNYELLRKDYKYNILVANVTSIVLESVDIHF